MRWQELENGDLLSAAEAEGFDLMITADKNLSYQQNLVGRGRALLILHTNDWNTLKVDVERVIAALQGATPGSFKRME